MEIRRIRIASIGAETLAGVGDARAMGWIGRVLARTQAPEIELESYVLAAPHQTTEDLSHRWEDEARLRFSPLTENFLLVAVPGHDANLDSSSARSRLNLANILDRAAQQNIDVLVVGPTPTLDEDRNHRLETLNTAYRDVAERRDIHYVDTFTPLRDHEQWRSDLAGGQGTPGQAGYGLIAWLVLHRGWYPWLRLREPTT